MFYYGAGKRIDIFHSSIERRAGFVSAGVKLRLKQALAGSIISADKSRCNTSA